MSRRTKRDIQDELLDMAFGVPMLLSKFECSVCRGILNTSGNVWFCPHCLACVMNEDPRHTRAREDFFKPLYDEESWRKGRPVARNGVNL